MLLPALFLSAALAGSPAAPFDPSPSAPGLPASEAPRSACTPIDNGAVVANPCVDGAITLGLAGLGAGILVAGTPRDTTGASTDPTGRWSDRADSWSDWLSPGGIADGKGIVPIAASLGGSYALGAAYGDSRSGVADALITAQSAAATFAVTELLKTTISRPRPYTSDAFRKKHPDFDDYDDDAWKSMPSGHTSMAAAMSFTPATLWMLHELDKPVGERNLAGPIAATVGATALTTAAGHFRVRAGKHHTSDVVAGALLGGAIGVGVPLIHRALRPDAPKDAVERDGPTVDAVGVGPTGVQLSGRF